MRLNRFRPIAAPAGVLVGASYALILVGVSVTSEERVLGLDQPKRFCGAYLDCHRSVTLVDVEVRDRIGTTSAHGVFYIATLRFASDAVRATMRTGPVEAVVLDIDGRRYRRVPRVERALNPDDGDIGLHDTALEPGTWHTTRIVFDLPRAVTLPRLLVREAHWRARLVELFLIGDEDSLLHAKTTFALEPPRRAAGLTG